MKKSKTISISLEQTTYDKLKYLVNSSKTYPTVSRMVRHMIKEHLQRSRAVERRKARENTQDED